MSIRRGTSRSLACFESLAQSHILVRHFLQTTPPMSCINYDPSITMLLSPSFIMPTSLAMARAVIILSPVTILTFIPALWHFMIASGTSFLGRSRTPIIDSKMSSDF